MENMNTMGEKNVCGCPHHKIFPGLVVLFGLVFLLGALGVITSQTVAIMWPVIVIVAGLKKMMKRRCKCCQIQ